MTFNIDVDAGADADADADSQSGLLSVFAKLTASVNSLQSTMDKQFRREQWLLEHVPVTIPVLVQSLSTAATEIVDLGGPQPGREWVVRMIGAFTQTLSPNAALVTWYVGQRAPVVAAGILPANWIRWQFPSVPGFQNFTSDVIHIKNGEHLVVGLTGIAGNTPILIRADINDEILYDYDTRG